jgi:hypothetical protein
MNYNVFGEKNIVLREKNNIFEIFKYVNLNSNISLFLL